VVFGDIDDDEDVGSGKASEARTVVDEVAGGKPPNATAGHSLHLLLETRGI